jgi:hypothetical protein
MFNGNHFRRFSAQRFAPNTFGLSTFRAGAM